MIYTWVLFIIQLLILSLFNGIFITEIAVMYVIIVNSIIFCVEIYRNKEIRLVFIVGFVFRVAIMLFDLYARDIFVLPNSGGDSEGYYLSALQISENIDMIHSDIYGGVYSKLIGLIFYFVGPSRFLGQYLNVLLNMSSLYYLYKIFNVLKLDIKYLAIFSLFPQMMILSSLFLRESLIIFFLTISFYSYIKVLEKNNTYWLLLMLICGILAGSMHSGVLFILVGYIYSLFDMRIKKSGIDVSIILSLIMLIILTMFVYSRYGDNLLKKISFEDNEELYNIFNRRRGNSSYLLGYEVTSVKTFILYMPLRVLFFLISPLPHMWRGVSDVITFILDSSIYIFLIIKVIISKYQEFEYRYIIKGIIFSLILVSIIFGMGVFNTGTAIRHRAKFLYLVVTLLALLDKANKNNIKFNSLS